MTTATVDSHARIHEILVLRTIVAALDELRISTSVVADPVFDRCRPAGPLQGLPADCIFGCARRSVLIAAREDHDKRIGIRSGGRYHLFRLPASIEQAIATAVSDASYAPRAAGIVSSSSDELIQQLESMAQNGKAAAAEGPVRIGPCAGIAKIGSIANLAGHYASSFCTASCFPLF